MSRKKESGAGTINGDVGDAMDVDGGNGEVEDDEEGNDADVSGGCYGYLILSFFFY